MEAEDIGSIPRPTPVSLSAACMDVHHPRMDALHD